MTPDPNDPQTSSAPPSAGGAVPSYVNLSDPVQAAVWQAFQKKGITPRDQGDFTYWVNAINSSGGLDTGYANAGGTGTWQQRMDAAQGGVGDYGQGSTMAGYGNSGGHGFSFDPSQVASDPGFQFALQNGLGAVKSNLFSRGLGLSTGAGKDLANYATGAAYQGENQLFNQNLAGFQTNFNNLNTLAQYGYNGTNAAAGYNTGAAAAGATGTIGVGNAVNNGIGGATNAYTNYKLYQQVNPSSPTALPPDVGNYSPYSGNV